MSTPAARSPPPDDAEPVEQVVVPAAAPTVLVQALDAWRQRLNAAGIPCRAVAFHSDEESWSQAFASEEKVLNDSWVLLRTRITPENPVALARVGVAASADMLMATTVQLPGGQSGIVGACLSPPHSEKAIQLLLLSLGWLQLTLSAQAIAQNVHAGRLLELIGHVGSQSDARAAAQEWVNRTAAWVRAGAPASSGLGLTLFEMRRDRPHWWVASDTAWAEKASAAVQEATEVATRASVEMQEVTQGTWWALPILDDGQPVAVLVARNEAGPLVPEALATLRASAGLAEPLLRHWREAGRSLPRHLLEATRETWHKLWGPGHLTWKFAAIGLVAVSGVLLLWPVPDRVTANVVIEGRVRQVVTAPFEGFIAQVLVRPGDRVTKGQVLAKLDDRELKLEQGRYRSERDQAAGKQRQAMSERDAPAVALASAEVQQAEAQLALVESKLARAALTAPMDGMIVTGDWVQQIGGPVETGKEMFELATTDDYRVVLHVPDRSITLVHAGQTGALRLTGQPQQSHAFKVSTVTATATMQDGTNGFRVEAAWEGQAPPLSPGMQGVGKITVGTANLFTVWTRSSIDWLRLKLWGWWW
ncbi:MAG: HlyD family efflux transporter periplasmic adaptor subunit [Rhizobacter sp.]